MIKIDGETFNVGIVKVTRKANLDRVSHGTTLDGTIHYDPLGTYFDYDVTIDTKMINIAEYDRLYEVITTPVEYHIVTMPYGQETITFKAMIKTSNDSIIANYRNFRKWTGLKISFEALEPQKAVE